MDHPGVVEAERGVVDDLAASTERQHDGEGRRGDHIGMAEGRAASTVAIGGLGSPIASANSRIFSRLTS